MDVPVLSGENVMGLRVSGPWASAGSLVEKHCRKLPPGGLRASCVCLHGEVRLERGQRWQPCSPGSLAWCSPRPQVEGRAPCMNCPPSCGFSSWRASQARGSQGLQLFCSPWLRHLPIPGTLAPPHVGVLKLWVSHSGTPAEDGLPPRDPYLPTHRPPPRGSCDLVREVWEGLAGSAPHHPAEQAA